MYNYWHIFMNYIKPNCNIVFDTENDLVALWQSL
uniref:Uncharacterized protein n=1 Tax=viral metagenome TaxID=1070528 RepID=A0A6C0JZ08_9ZZZZ